MAEKDEKTMEHIVSLAKRRGFIYQGSEIYGGLAGTWDYGPHGVALKNNIRQLWWRMFVEEPANVYGLDAAIIMNSRVWQASGHAEGFSDPMVEDVETKQRYRADHLLEENGVDAEGLSLEQMRTAIKDNGIKSPSGNELSEPRSFNMMFETHVGAVGGEEGKTYLRPETAQGIFVNFKNIVDSFHPKLPFGIAQIGKAFRNEIAPRDFLFRVRELEQMEVEYFVREDQWSDAFERWRQTMWRFIDALGLSHESVHEHDMPEEELAHYSKRTIDFEYDYPFGRKELYGLAYRTDYDLAKHSEHSGVSLTYRDDESGEVFTPHVIEPSLGLDRSVLAVLLEAYTEDTLGDETRVFLKLPPQLAPIKVAIFPLLKNKPDLVSYARDLHETIRGDIPNTAFDDHGNIGKRYRRQDEVGTPLCVTVDFQTLDDDTVTVRDRDSGEQERVAVSDLSKVLSERLSF